MLVNKIVAVRRITHSREEIHRRSIVSSEYPRTKSRVDSLTIGRGIPRDLRREVTRYLKLNSLS